MIVDRLKKLRMARQISQNNLAKHIGVSQQTVASWKVGRTEPANEFLRKMADYFNVSTDYLLGHDKINQDTSLSNEQADLLNDFDSLNPTGRNVLLEVINSLRRTHSKNNNSNIVSADGVF